MDLRPFKKIKAIIAILLSFVIASSNNLLFAAVLPYMPPAGQLTLPGSAYDLPRLVGMRFTSDDPSHFTFILNAGNDKTSESLLRREIAKIDKYFLAALTLPADELWVNLSPYENNRISTDALAATDLGKDLLGEDYVLKQLAASLTYPETETGKRYWDAINNSTTPHGGSSATNSSSAPSTSTRSSFTKVWIVPGKIKILETKTQAVIKEATFKVMVDEDSLAMQNNNVGARSPRPLSGRGNPATTGDATTAFKTYILPLIEKEVNSGERFAALRQAYSAMIMAVWFKEKLKKTILKEYYLDKKKLNGAQADDPGIREKIYNEYVAAFNKGVYNYVKKEAVGANSYSPVKKIMKRAYFSGGVGFKTLPAEVLGGATAVSESAEAMALQDAAATIEADRVLTPLLSKADDISPAQKKADLEGAVRCIMLRNPRQATPIFQRCLIGGPIGSSGAFRHVKEGMAQRITNALKEQAFLGWPESDLIVLAGIFIDRANLYLQGTSRKMPAFLKIAKQIDNIFPAGYSRGQAMAILKALAASPHKTSGVVQDGSPAGGFDFTQAVSQEIETQGAGLNFSSREAKAELAKLSGMYLETLALRY